MNNESFDRGEADRLVAELIGDPESFEKKGRANELLKQFFRGYPLEALRSLLRHHNGGVVRAGVWIASELPSNALALLSDVLSVSASPDRNVRFYALDVVAMGAIGGHEEEFVRVVNALDDPDAAVRDHALFLVSRATDDQLRAAMKRLDRANRRSHHFAGLQALVDAQLATPPEVEKMIESDDQLNRQYGLAIAERCYKIYPHLLEIAANSKDELIRSLADHMLKQHRVGGTTRESR
jgi:hypothetical protein